MLYVEFDSLPVLKIRLSIVEKSSSMIMPLGFCFWRENYKLFEKTNSHSISHSLNRGLVSSIKKKNTKIYIWVKARASFFWGGGGRQGGDQPSISLVFFTMQNINYPCGSKIPEVISTLRFHKHLLLPRGPTGYKPTGKFSSYYRDWQILRTC